MITVGFLPWWPQNPYQLLLKRELNALGVRVIGNPPLSLLRILFGRDGLDVVHVHWPHGLYGTMGQCLHALAVLGLYRLLRNNVVWTVHELDAYESRFPRRDAWFRFMLSRMSRRLIVHGEHTRRTLCGRLGYRRPVDLARHASYVGWYEDDLSGEQARQRLGLPQGSRVYLYFGYIKPYKGVEDLIEAFRALPDESARLLVVGKPLDEAIQAHVESLAAADSRVRTVMRFVPDDEVQTYFRAAHVAVFPFRHTQTSGSVMLAMSFGCAVIAPRIATVPEYVDERCGMLFDPTLPGDLARALQAAAAAPLDTMGAEARRQAEALTWADMAKVHFDAYQAVCRP
ncbi:glycosyltransferase [Azohydromonas sediminis]|uniref:glycosyltransferase n=1 Tax=Azohydromonas sediminis TaxID=2259674 RepID=UPI0013C2E756|nr:glycosyltransferase [Azohydromonas sediminis]